MEKLQFVQNSVYVFDVVLKVDKDKMNPTNQAKLQKKFGKNERWLSGWQFNEYISTGVISSK